MVVALPDFFGIASPNGCQDQRVRIVQGRAVREEVRVERGGFVGIDVSGDRLDVAFRPGERLQVGNDPRGITRLTKMLERSQPELIVLEASGGYEVALLERLFAKKLSVALLNPRHVREFARASGRLAKTDAIDAEVLAHFAQVMKPEPRQMADPETRKLRALVTRRRQLVQMVTAELNRRRHSLEVVREGFVAMHGSVI
jgi:transposase